MVTRQSRATANSVNSLLEQRDIVGLLAVAGGTAGGVLLTQRIANQVLPLVGLSPTPSSLVDGLGAAGVKTGVAAAFMYGALQLTGIGRVLLAFLSVGSLTSAGFDLVGLFFETPDLRQMKEAGTSGGGSVSAQSVSSGSVSAQQSDNMMMQQSDDMMMQAPSRDRVQFR